MDTKVPTDSRDFWGAGGKAEVGSRAARWGLLASKGAKNGRRHAMGSTSLNTGLLPL